MSTPQEQRRTKAAASKAVQALAQAVEAGKAGLPPTPEALAELGAVLHALKDGADPAKVLGYKRAIAGKPGPDKTLQEQAVRRMLELRNQRLDDSDAKVADVVYMEFVGAGLIDPEGSDPKKRVSFATFYENWWLGKGAKNQKTDTRVVRKYRRKTVRKVTKVRAAMELEQWENGNDVSDPNPRPDRPDASEDFK